MHRVESELRIPQRKIRHLENQEDLLPHYGHSGPCAEGQRYHQSGQIVVEYILLLIVSVVIAAFLITTLVGSMSGGGGVVVDLWQKLTGAVARDYADAP